MFTLFDLQELCADEKKLTAFLKKYGVLSGVKACSCGSPLGSKWYLDHGSSYRRCTDQACRRRAVPKIGFLG